MTSDLAQVSLHDQVNTLQQLRVLIHLGRVLEQIIADLEPKLIGCSREQELAYKQALKDFRQELAEHASVPYEGRFLQQREAVGMAKGLRMAAKHLKTNAHMPHHIGPLWNAGWADAAQSFANWCEAKAKEVEHESSYRSHDNPVGPDSHK